MLERFTHLIIRLKEILLRTDEASAGNAAEITSLTAEVFTLRKDQADTLKALDELEGVIKKWES
tara:strand:+ start:223 stop:414 length:192 start_codon:yes stop_codon:yes gene_type:complete